MPLTSGRMNAAPARWPALLLLAVACGCTPPGSKPPAAGLATPAREIVITDDKLASAAGLEILRRGGTAVDAAIAAEAVLGLVEPNASGPGGGSVLLLWQAQAGGLSVIDGTPRAGSRAPEGLNADASGQPLDPASVAYGGGAVGVPGTLPALWAAHQAQGKLPWADLFQPAIRLAQDGFPMPRGLHALLSGPGAPGFAAIAALYGPTLPRPGETARNPAYAGTLRRVAALGPAGLWAGGGMAEAMAALGQGARPSHLSAADLQGYRATRSEALCMVWLDWRLCTAPPPVYGGVLALQLVAMAGPGDLAEAGYAHRFADAGRLAQADRRRYAADPDFVPVPAAALLDPGYLAARAALIQPQRALVRPPAGVPGQQARYQDDPGRPVTATSQIVVVARNGDAVSMTSSLTHVFGARVVAGGMPLNNALANFSPVAPSGVRYANAMAPDKRPATPMAPVMAFDARGQPVLLGGSGGGPGVPDFVAQALLGLLPGQAAAASVLGQPHLSSADTDHLALEAGTAATQLAAPLEAMGHAAAAEPLPSGSIFARRSGAGWLGFADPRRDGVALGD